MAYKRGRRLYTGLRRANTAYRTGRRVARNFSKYALQGQVPQFRKMSRRHPRMARALKGILRQPGTKALAGVGYAHANAYVAKQKAMITAAKHQQLARAKLKVANLHANIIKNH